MRNGASLAGRGGLGLRTRLWSEEKSSREVWWSERLLGEAGPLTSPLASSGESGFVKERAKQFKNIFKRRPRAYIALLLIKII